MLALLFKLRSRLNSQKARFTQLQQLCNITKFSQKIKFLHQVNNKKSFITVILQKICLLKNQQFDIFIIKRLHNSCLKPKPLLQGQMQINKVLRKESSRLQFDYQSKSLQGKIPGNLNIPKPNQDCLVEYPNLLPGIHFFAVCDGHGSEGHSISQFLRKRLPKNIAVQIQKSNNEITEASIKLAFSLTNSQLLLSREISAELSGSTCVAMLLDDARGVLWEINLGDSRIITARQGKCGWKVVQSLEDQKPGNCLERGRIEAAGGVVSPFRSCEGKEFGPNRVWIKGCLGPGLAISRAFGDAIAQQVGVICVPEIRKTQLRDEKFVVLGSDGVFQFLSNDQVMRLVVPYYANNRLKYAAKKVANEALKLWTYNESFVDDITCLIIFFKGATQLK